jgi:hypothetical protein
MGTRDAKVSIKQRDEGLPEPSFLVVSLYRLFAERDSCRQMKMARLASPYGAMRLALLGKPYEKSPGWRIRRALTDCLIYCHFTKLHTHTHTHTHAAHITGQMRQAYMNTESVNPKGHRRPERAFRSEFTDVPHAFFAERIQKQ